MKPFVASVALCLLLSGCGAAGVTIGTGIVSTLVGNLMSDFAEKKITETTAPDDKSKAP